MDRHPPLTTHKHELLIILRKASLFPKTSTMIFAAVKNETVARVLNFRVRVLLKSAVIYIRAEGAAKIEDIMQRKKIGFDKKQKKQSKTITIGDNNFDSQHY